MLGGNASATHCHCPDWLWVTSRALKVPPGTIPPRLVVSELRPLLKSLQASFQCEGTMYTFPRCFPSEDFQTTALKLLTPSVVSLVSSDVCWHFSLEKYLYEVLCLRTFRCWNHPCTGSPYPGGVPPDCLVH